MINKELDNIFNDMLMGLVKTKERVEEYLIKEIKEDLQ